MRGNLILDLQFGSTGKGLIAGFLAERDMPDTVCTAWAANAGHTYIDRVGNRYIHTMLANGVVSPNLKRILIGPGSLIDPEALRREIDQCAHLLIGVDILIHPHAAIITPKHRALEATVGVIGAMTKIGSTKKGCGEAAIERIRRDPDNHNTARVMVTANGLDAYAWASNWALVPHNLAQYVVSVDEYNNALDQAKVIQVEGAQGYSLSMYHGFYPYTTSRDVSTAQVIADCGIPWSVARRLNVVGCVRTYPIRVANRFNDSGKQVGWSGPCYHDQIELEWQQDLGREAELTTVTKLPRRIFSWSEQQVAEAIRLCGVDELFVNFINYLPSAEAAASWLYGLQSQLYKQWGQGHGARIAYLGVGPSAGDVLEYPVGSSIIAHLQALDWSKLS